MRRSLPESTDSPRAFVHPFPTGYQEMRAGKSSSSSYEHPIEFRYYDPATGSSHGILVPPSERVSNRSYWRRDKSGLEGGEEEG